MWLTKRGSVVVNPDVESLTGLDRQRSGPSLVGFYYTALGLGVFNYFPCFRVTGHHAKQQAPGAVVDGGAVGVLLAEGWGVGVKHGGWGWSVGWGGGTSGLARETSCPSPLSSNTSDI